MPLALDKFYNGILSSIVLYAGVLALGNLVESRDRLALARVERARLKETLSKAQLDALRRQIEPHFLFNTLNAVAGLIRERRSDEAVRTIALLSDFLRRTIDDSARQEVPLREEMELAQIYLDIARVRFADRLQLRIENSKRSLSGGCAQSHPAAARGKRGEARHREASAGR